jgi:Transglutaminase-like superfamily
MKPIIREIVATQSLGDAWLLGRIILFALFLPFLLSRDLRSLARVIEPRRVPSPAPAPTINKIARYADAVCASRLVRGECLVRGLTRYYFLRRAGLPVRLIFGMGDINGRLEGHCWLVQEGRPFLESGNPERHFTRMLTFPLDEASRNNA